MRDKSGKFTDGHKVLGGFATRFKPGVKSGGVGKPKHGMTNSPEYRAWAGAKNRCHNANFPRFKDWGARGIKVCLEWRWNFMAFYNYMGPKPSLQHSLDRYPNPDGGYEPGNVRWATPSEQAHNHRKAQPIR